MKTQINNMNNMYQGISNFFISLDKISKFIIIVGLFISFYSFFFFLSNKIFLIGSDAFYYISIADSIVKYSEMRDITAIPSWPVKTPQNGIVFIHVILSLIGIGAKGRILSIVVINYLLYLSGIYPLYKIARFCGLKKGFPLISLLSVYLGAWHMYRFNMLALNDGFFNSLTVWFVYLVIKFVRDIDLLESSAFYKPAIKKMLIIYLFVIVLVQFRLNASLVIGSAVISALLVKKYRVSALLILGSLVLLFSFILIYTLIEVPSLESSGLRRLYSMFWSSNVYTIKLQLWKILPHLIAGLSGLTNPFATLLFTIFPLSMIYFGAKGIIEKNFSKVFIVIICLTALWFTMSFPRARYIWYIFPFIYLIILSLKRIRWVGYAFVLLVFLQSVQEFYIGFPRGPESKFWLHVYNHKISLPENALLSSYRRRHPYFFLKTRNYLGNDSWGKIHEQIEAPGKFMPKLNWNLINDHGSLYVMGDSTYIDSTFSQVSELARVMNYIPTKKLLTPVLDEFDGWGLVEIELDKFY